MNLVDVSLNLEKEITEKMFLDNENHPYRILTRTTLLTQTGSRLNYEEVFFVAYLDSGRNRYIPIKTSRHHISLGNHRGLRKVS